jgi:hypothetical protein
MKTVQTIRIVGTYIDKHPEKMQTDFHMLAILALTEAWPCED